MSEKQLNQTVQVCLCTLFLTAAGLRAAATLPLCLCNRRANQMRHKKFREFRLKVRGRSVPAAARTPATGEDELKQVEG